MADLGPSDNRCRTDTGCAWPNLLPNFAVPGYFKHLIQLIQQPHARLSEREGETR